MKHYSSGLSLLLLILLTLSSSENYSEPVSLKVNYYEIENPGTWYFIPGGLDPPWQLDILNQLVYNESTPHPAKIMMGENTPRGPIIRLDLGFYRGFILQVNTIPENDDSQISQIPWSANASIIVLRQSYLSISDGSVKLFAKPFTEFRIDFLIFWSANQVLLNGTLYIQWRHHQITVNPLVALILNLSGAISRISVVDLTIFVVVLLITYKGWIFLLKQLKEKR